MMVPHYCQRVAIIHTYPYHVLIPASAATKASIFPPALAASALPRMSTTMKQTLTPYWLPFMGLWKSIATRKNSDSDIWHWIETLVPCSSHCNNELAVNVVLECSGYAFSKCGIIMYPLWIYIKSIIHWLNRCYYW